MDAAPDVRRRRADRRSGRGAGPDRRRLGARQGPDLGRPPLLLRRRLADRADRRRDHPHGPGPDRHPADDHQLGDHRPHGGPRRQRLVCDRPPGRRGREGRDPGDPVHLRNPDVGREDARRAQLQAEELRRVRAAQAGGAGRVEALPRRGGGAVRPERPVLRRQPGRARGPDHGLADLERAELAHVLQAEAEAGRLREARRGVAGGDRGQGPARQGAARRHVRLSRGARRSRSCSRGTSCTSSTPSPGSPTRSPASPSTPTRRA